MIDQRPQGGIPAPIYGQITFLYYDDLAPAAAFYGDVMGFELVEDQAWARIYRVGDDAFLGIVAGEKGYHRPQARNAVLLTLVVDDVPGWYDYLAGHGVAMLSEVQDRPEIQIRCFFLEDPGSYTLEIQEFLRPDLVETFYHGAGRVDAVGGA
ncbi:MAG: VOC family protein [Anaerolineae bacterium]|jgi:predicted enzyme related to lactoylglutathione lyase